MTKVILIKAEYRCMVQDRNRNFDSDEIPGPQLPKYFKIQCFGKYIELLWNNIDNTIVPAHMWYKYYRAQTNGFAIFLACSLRTRYG